jgi:hypothetical protein
MALTACVSTSHEKWQLVFDGKTLDGWAARGGNAKYAVEDSCIVGTTAGETANSFLCTERSYADFVLELEVKADAGLNSGVQIRSHCFDYQTNLVWKGETKTIPAGRVHGYQIEVDARPERRWSGGIYDEARRGWLVSLETNQVAQQAYKFGEWNAYRIECVGPSIRTWVNGIPIASLTDADPTEGFIGLQVHGTDTSGLQVRFRNIKVQEKAK